MLTLELNFDEKNEVGISKLIGEGTIVIKTFEYPYQLMDYITNKNPDLIKVLHKTVLDSLYEYLCVCGIEYQVGYVH
jgi:hypothetical protein